MTDMETRQLLQAFTEFRLDITEKITRLEGKVVALEEKVGGLQSTNRWIVRTVGALLIASLLGTLFISGGGHI